MTPRRPAHPAKPDTAGQAHVRIPPLARVVLWMIGTLLSFSAMAVSIRELSATLSIMEILSARSAIALLILAALIGLRPQLRHALNRRRLPLHLLRNGIHFGAQYLWATSLLLLPLSTVFALEFTMPAWTMLMARLSLGERMTPSRIGAVVLGLAGVLVILRPGIATFHPAALLVLAAAVGYSVQNIATKKLTTTESTFAIVVWMNVIQLPLGLLGADPLFAMRLGLHELPALAGLGISGLSAHYCLSNAFRAGDASLVVPLDFLRIPLIAVVGWWLYGEPLDLFVFAGAGLIILGLLWNLRSEARTAVARSAPAPQMVLPETETS
ncbi:MAG TPA: DMT family transporter [Xanthobacteraceae bacterium]|nr:DMT family transporter [Xanthobacteraceae bacterium]